MAHSIKAFVILSLLAVSATGSFAQDETIVPSTKSGSAAWMFDFGGLLNLQLGAVTITDANPLSGTGAIMGAGFKTFIADNLAIRVALGLDIESSGDKDKNGSLSGTAFGIGAGVEFHTTPVYTVSPYFGAEISFGSASSERQVTAGNVDTKTSGSIFGIAALAGFDWYFTHGIAVGGEYALGFASASASTTTSGATVDQPSASLIGIGSGNVHLVVHF